MYCKKCGKELPNEALFCPACGNGVDGPAPSTNESVAPTSRSKGLVVAVSVAATLAIISCVFVVLVLTGVIGGGNNETETVVTDTNLSQTSDDNEKDGIPTTPDPAPAADEETPSPEPTVEPTPEPTPEPVSKYLSDKEFNNLDEIINYCKNSDDGYYIEKIIVNSLKIKAAQGMTKAYEILGWMGRHYVTGNKIFIKENGTYHEYLNLGGQIVAVSSDGNYIRTWNRPDGMVGFFEIYEYSEDESCFEDIDGGEYNPIAEEGDKNSFDIVFNKVLRKNGLDSIVFNDVNSKWIKDIDLMS